MDIGLSSEEEAEDLEDNPAIRRKYRHSAPPATSATTTGGTATATTSTATGPEMATVQIPVAALQKVHDLLGKMLEGQLPSEPQQSAQADVPGEVPFSISKPKRGDKKCTICFRSFLVHWLFEETLEVSYWEADSHLYQPRMWQEIVFQEVLGTTPDNLPEGKNQILQKGWM